MKTKQHLCALGLLAILLPSCKHSDDPAAAGGATAGAERVVSVTMATTEQRDVPVYLNGLGAVSAFYTVTVRSQVDGRLDKVLFREGQEVREGQLLALIDLRPYTIALNNAQAALARDVATLKNNKQNLERYKVLRSKNLIPEQQLTDQQALVDQFEGTILADDAAVDSAKLNLDYAHITSPIRGVTGVRLVDPGNLIHATDPNGLVVVTQLEPIAVLFTLPEDDLPRVAKQMQHETLKAEAFSRDGKQDLGIGEVKLIDNQINTGSGTIRIKAVFPNPDHALWPNQFVKVRLLLNTLKDATVVPAPVVQRGPQGTFAYVINADKTVAPRPIEVASIEGDEAIIKSGLQQGEQVVTDGQYQLHPGSKVNARPVEKAENKKPQPAADGNTPTDTTDANSRRGAP